MLSPKDDLVKKAKSGDESARNDLIEHHKPFILKVSARFCGRSLTWENDEELSIALMAFNEAIDGFDHTQGSSFLSYAYMVINRRLTDYMRKEGKKRQRLILEKNDRESFNTYSFDHAAYSDKDIERVMWQEEIQSFKKVLKSYGIKIEDLVASSPKHMQVRQKLAYIAREISADKELLNYIHKSHRLPVKEISRRFKLRRKFVETWRRYLLALVIINTGPEFTLIKEYIKSLFEEGSIRNEKS